MIVAGQETADQLISEKDFELVSALLKELSGIHLNPQKRAMVSGRLAKRVKALGLHGFQEYFDLLKRESETVERDAFVMALTTNVTRFRREPHHFKHFAEEMLPELIKVARSGGRVRIWSAACSTGEEPYDLAFLLLNACPEVRSLDVRILATDIDRSALEKAKRGVYNVGSLSELPQDIRNSVFSEKNTPPGKAEVCEDARALIAFRQLNLHGEWPFKGPFDVILCRNVTIYFDEETSDRLWRRLASLLRPGGALYSGHSETVPQDIIDVAEQFASGTYQFPNGYALSSVAKEKFA